MDNNERIGILKEVLELVDTTCDDIEVVADESMRLEDYLCSFAFAWDIPSRLPVKELWKGPGIYRFNLIYDPALTGEPFEERQPGLELAVDFVCPKEEYDKVPLEPVDTTDMPF